MTKKLRLPMIGLIALLILSLKGLSQPPSTTDNVIVKLKANVARNVYKDALQKPILEEKIIILNERISNYQLVIKTLQEKDSIQRVFLKSQVDTLLKEKELYINQMEGYEELLKRERKRRKAAHVLGIISTAAAVYLIISK